MDPENKEDPNEFGKVIDALHEKGKLPSLRTFQGDMAEFIKNKDESVISIALKEKERKEEKEEEKKAKEREKEERIPAHRVNESVIGVEKEIKILEKKEPEISLKPSPKPGRNLQINFTMLLLSLGLILGGVAVFYYVFIFIKAEPPAQVVIENEIIPYNNLSTVANMTNENLGAELGKLSPVSGVNIVKISDASGQTLSKAKDFFNFLKISSPAALGRTLRDAYVIGIISQNNQNSTFMIITVSDFGGAFSAMLDWEGNMDKDLSFLNPETNNNVLAGTTINITASTTATTTIVVNIPMKVDSFSWKDVIVKNKDTRALVNQNGQAKIAYTFLDKNTILIVNNLSAIGEISSIYASRSVAR